MKMSETRRVPAGAFSGRLIWLMVVWLLAAGALGASEGPAGTAPASPTSIEVSFRLDPRITKAAYVGDRWVSPPTYARAGTGDELTVEARVECRDAHGRPSPATPTWSSSNPEMVTVAQPLDSRHYEIAVRGTGMTTLELGCGEALKELSITATPRDDNGLYIEITQAPTSSRQRP